MEQIGLKNDVVKLQQILGSKLYSSKYSFISEVCQNATDSMRKAGKHDQPFDLGIDESNCFFVRDYGTSFDDKETIVKYLCTLLESSKTQVKDENENQEIGKYGIGKISSAAYNSEWFYSIYKNGKGIDLRVFEIENKGIFYDISDYYDTTEPDGVLYRIALKESVSSFVSNLIPKIKYFQNIFFKFHANHLHNNRELTLLNENFHVYRTDDFQFSTLGTDTKYMHICIDQYAYPINWDKMSYLAIDIPVGLRFGLDELDINPTREALIINDQYEAKVDEKIRKTVDWFINEYNKQNPVVTYTNMKEYHKAWTNFEANKYVKIGEQFINIQQIVSTFNLFDKLNRPQLQGFTRSAYSDFWDRIAKIHKYIFVPKAMVYGRKLYRDPHVGSMQENNNYLLDTTFSIYKKDYFKGLADGNRYLFFQMPEVKYEIWTAQGDAPYSTRRIHYDRLFSIDSDMYNLDTGYTGIINQKIEDFQRFLKMFMDSYFQKISDVNIPAPPKKKRTTITAQTGEIKVKKARNTYKYSDSFCTFADDVLLLEDAYKKKRLTIYGSSDQDKLNLDSMYPYCKNKFDLLILTEKNAKIMDNMNLHNFVNINKIKDNLNLVSSVITAYHIDKTLEKYEDVIEKRDIIRKFISTKLADDLDSLINYEQKFSNSIFMRGYQSEATLFMKELYDMFLENPVLFKADVTAILDRVMTDLEKVDFVIMFNDQIADDPKSWRTTEKYELNKQIDIIKDLCKYRAMKMDWQHYKPFVLDEHSEPQHENA